MKPEGRPTGQERGGIPGLPLLPFVDIVFSTTAVLMVVMLVHQMMRQQPEIKPLPRPYLLTCDADVALVFYRPNFPAEQVPVQRLRAILRNIAESEVLPLALFAFGGACTWVYWELQTALEDIGRQAARGNSPPPPSFTYAPLSSTPQAAAEFALAWRQAAEAVR
jgi:hypothetical protein